MALGGDGKVSLAASHHILLELPVAAYDWGSGRSRRQLWQRYRGGTYSFVSTTAPVGSSPGAGGQTWGQRLALPPGTGSLTSSALSPWVEASWQGTGRAHTALFWEQVWLLALPTWALGTLHTWHLQMRSQRGRSHRCHSREVGFSQTSSVLLASTCSTVSHGREHSREDPG